MMQVSNEVARLAFPDPNVDGKNEQVGSHDFQKAFDSVRSVMNDADAKAADAMVGKGSIHSAMIAMTKADLGFRFFTQVRGKAVDAYRQLMNLQF